MKEISRILGKGEERNPSKRKDIWKPPKQGSAKINIDVSFSLETMTGSTS
jgi:hypothetical protein